MKTRAQILGENLKRVLNEKGISRKEFAEKLNVSPVAVGLYINGQREPSLEKLFEMAKFLDVSIVNLLGDNEKIIEDQILDSDFKFAIELLDLTEIFAAPAENDKDKVNLFILKSGKITQTDKGIYLKDGEYDVYTTTKKAFVILIKSLVTMMLSVGNKHFEELIKKSLETAIEK